jgi:hypothetical protein
VRSASNAYFAELMSVISLPDKNEAVSARHDEIWDLIRDVDAVAELDLLRKLQAPVRAALEGTPRVRCWSSLGSAGQEAWMIGRSKRPSLTSLPAGKT